MGFRPDSSCGEPVEKPIPLGRFPTPTPRFSALSANGPCFPIGDKPDENPLCGVNASTTAG